MLELSVTKLENVHLTNTAALLVNLQEMGVLKDGHEILAKINGQRKTPMKPVDHPAKTTRHRSSLKGAVVRTGWEG